MQSFESRAFALYTVRQKVPVPAPGTKPGAVRALAVLFFPDKSAVVPLFLFSWLLRWSVGLADVLAKLNVYQVFVDGIKDELLTAFGTLILSHPLRITLFNSSKVNRHLS
jgi:hypothetical protein